jgi:hypothetical protein
MLIECGHDVAQAVKVLEQAKRLSGILEDGFRIAGELDRHGLEYPDLEDAICSTNRALDQIEESLNRYAGRAV